METMEVFKIPDPKFYALSKYRAQGGNTGRLDLYGEISSTEFWGDEKTPSALLSELRDLGPLDALDVHIFSNGGDVFAGLAIYSILRQRTEPVNVYIEGIAASIATVIACAGDRVYMGDADMIFIHNPPTMLFFESLNAKEARALADELDIVRKPMVAAYMSKTGKAEAEIVSVMSGDDGDGTWFTAAQAIEFGLADDYTPDAKRPREAAACLRPAVFRWKGHVIDTSKYPDAQKHTASIKQKKGVTRQMAKQVTKRKANKPKSPRAEATFIEMVCPYCGANLLLDPESALVVLAGEGETEEPVEEVQARRTKGNMRAELFTVFCPVCSEEFAWDTDAQPDGSDGEPIVETETVEAIPDEDSEPAAKRIRKAKARAKSKAKARKIRAEVAQATCPECGATVTYDTDSTEIVTDEGLEGYSLTCGECGAVFLEPLEAPVPDALPTDASAAYKMGVLAERRRMLALDDMAGAVPGCEDMINAAKRSGASAEAISGNVFKAMARNPAIVGAKHMAAIERDAAHLGNMPLPQHYNQKNIYAQGVMNVLNDR